MGWNLVKHPDQSKLLKSLGVMRTRLRRYERHAETVAGTTRRETVRLAAKARARCYREIGLLLASVVEDSCS